MKNLILVATMAIVLQVSLWVNPIGYQRQPILN